MLQWKFLWSLALSGPKYLGCLYTWGSWRSSDTSLVSRAFGAPVASTIVLPFGNRWIDEGWCVCCLGVGLYICCVLTCRSLYIMFTTWSWGVHCTFISPKRTKTHTVAGSLLWRDVGVFSHSVHVKWVERISPRPSCSERWHRPLYCKKQVLLRGKAFIFFPSMFEVTLNFQTWIKIWVFLQQKI